MSSPIKSPMETENLTNEKLEEENNLIVGSSEQTKRKIIDHGKMIQSTCVSGMSQTNNGLLKRENGNLSHELQHLKTSHKIQAEEIFSLKETLKGKELCSQEKLHPTGENNTEVELLQNLTVADASLIEYKAKLDCANSTIEMNEMEIDSLQRALQSSKKELKEAQVELKKMQDLYKAKLEFFTETIHSLSSKLSATGQQQEIANKNRLESAEVILNDVEESRKETYVQMDSLNKEICELKKKTEGSGAQANKRVQIMKAMYHVPTGSFSEATGTEKQAASPTSYEKEKETLNSTDTVTRPRRRPLRTQKMNCAKTKSLPTDKPQVPEDNQQTSKTQDTRGKEENSIKTVNSVNASEAKSNSNTWQCSACTFLNDSTKDMCDMCSKSRVTTMKQPMIKPNPTYAYMPYTQPMMKPTMNGYYFPPNGYPAPAMPANFQYPVPTGPLAFLEPHNRGYDVIDRGVSYEFRHTEHINNDLYKVKDNEVKVNVLEKGTDNDESRFEDRDYVYRNLESQGYSKDLGERADFLSQPIEISGAECSKCTLVNPKHLKICEACGASLKRFPTYI